MNYSRSKSHFLRPINQIQIALKQKSSNLNSPQKLQSTPRRLKLTPRCPTSITRCLKSTTTDPKSTPRGSKSNIRNPYSIPKGQKITPRWNRHFPFCLSISKRNFEMGKKIYFTTIIKSFNLKIRSFAVK